MSHKAGGNQKTVVSKEPSEVLHKVEIKHYVKNSEIKPGQRLNTQDTEVWFKRRLKFFYS